MNREPAVVWTPPLVFALVTGCASLVTGLYMWKASTDST